MELKYSITTYEAPPKWLLSNCMHHTAGEAFLLFVRTFGFQDQEKEPESSPRVTRAIGEALVVPAVWEHAEGRTGPSAGGAFVYQLS